MYRLILKVPIKLTHQALFSWHTTIILLATLLGQPLQAALTITPQGPGGVTGEPVTITTTEPTDDGTGSEPTYDDTGTEPTDDDTGTEPTDDAGSSQQQPTQTVNTQQEPLDTAALTITPQGPGGVTGEPVTITTTEPTDDGTGTEPTDDDTGTEPTDDAGSSQQQPTQTVNTQQEPLDTIDTTPINNAPFQTLPLAPPVPAEAVAGRLLIKFKQKPAESFSPTETGDPQLNELMQRFQVKSVRPLLSTADSVTSPSTTPVLKMSIYIAEFPEDIDVNAAATAFSATLATEYAEPDYIAGIFAQPNDPHLSFQWGLYNLGQTGGTAGADVSAPEGWEINTGSEAITLAIVDTGVDLTHEDLKDNIVPGYDFYNDDTDPSDDHGHGTFVAGIAAAQTHNGVGIAGVCWHCGIMPIKVFNNNGLGSWSTVAQGIVYAVEHGAQVINLSLGSAKLSSAIQDAVAFANS
ncbi:MAG: S8 family serine peptidase, partial [Pseudomonadota bacterium]|nr:S8 family serine peptidase [Pseudomonadota bacterium]